MRRTILYILLALSTFTLSFLIVGTFEQLTIALPVALAIFTLIKKIASRNPTLHHLKVAILTLLIWIPFAAISLSVVLPISQSCEPDFSVEDVVIESPKEPEEQKQDILKIESQIQGFADSDTIYCSKNEGNTIWAGVLDNKAISKPEPRYLSLDKASNIATTVAVAVIIDMETGKVISAQALSGHPLFRQSAVDAAYKARFHPTRECWMKPNVCGVLTYHFGF